MSFSSSLLPEHRSLGIWRWRVWGGFKKLFVRPSDGFGALSKHSTESKRYSPPLNPPLEMNYICSNWKLFFFPLPPFFLVISLKDNVPECPCAFPPGCFWLFLPSLPASHPMFSFLCLNFAGPCRQSGPRTPAPTPSPCISKGSESAVAKAQGEQHNSTHDAMRRSSS